MLILCKLNRLNMKKTATLILVTLMLSFGACATQTDKVVPYSFNSAKIEYKISGDINGNMTAFVKGDHSVNKVSATNTEGGTPVSTLTIDLGETIYFIDQVKKEGYSSKNYIYQDLKGLSKNEKLARLTAYATNTYSSETKAEKTGQKEYAGEKCDLYQIDGGEICLWQGIPLYSNVTIGADGRTIEATSIQTEVEVADSEFTLPEGISIQDVETAE